RSAERAGLVEQFRPDPLRAAGARDSVGGEGPVVSYRWSGGEYTMRLPALLIALAAFLVALDPSDGVREAAEGWRQGAIRQDRALPERHLADELVYTHGGGKRQTKAEYIADVTKGPPHYESFTPSGTNIRVYGRVAVLTGIVDVKTPKREPYR